MKFTFSKKNTVKKSPLDKMTDWVREHDLKDYAELLKHNLDYKIDITHPMFLAPDGNIIDVTKAVNGTHHQAYPTAIFDELSPNYFLVLPSVDQKQKMEDEIFWSLMLDKNWIRLNPGTDATKGYMYIAIGPTLPTNIQFTVLEEFLTKCWDNGQKQIDIVVGQTKTEPGVQHRYKFDETFPEDIVKRIKKYFSSGRLDEDVDNNEYAISLPNNLVYFIKSLSEDDVDNLLYYLYTVLDIEFRISDSCSSVLFNAGKKLSEEELCLMYTNVVSCISSYENTHN